MNSLEMHLAGRFLLSRKRKGFLSVAAVVAILGMAFGVAALLITLSVISGFQREYKKAILGFNSHVILMNADEMEHPEALVERVIAEDPSHAIKMLGSSPFVYREGMAISGKQIRGVVLKGIDFDRFNRLSHMKILAGSTENPEHLPALLLGKALARDLGTLDSAGSARTIRILFPQGNKPEAEGIRNVRRFFVKGTFESGLYEYDSSFAFLPLADAEKFFQTKGRVSGLEIWLEDPDQAEILSERIRSGSDSPQIVLTWRELNENLFRALELEKLIFSILMMTLVTVASLNILGTLMMLLLEKRNEIASLRAIGLSWRRLRKIFLFDGLLIGSAGIILGLGLGLGVLSVLERWQPIRLAAEVYLVSRVPVSLSWVLLARVALAALGVVLLGCELALRKISKLSSLRMLLES